MTNDLAFYMHAGSGNHGCEAIVDSLARMLRNKKILLVTNSAAEDEKYLPEEVREHLTIAEEQHISEHFFTHALYYVRRRLTGDRESFLRYRLSPMTGTEKPSLAVSIGGDNYCYPSMVEDLMLSNSMLNRQGTKTVLLGCSIEPELLKNPGILEDMNRYAKIIARESITYAALEKAGIPAEKLACCPDPAFALPSDESALPEDFACGNTVGINLSPMAKDYAEDKTAPVRCMKELIEYILRETNMDVALIPHVVWERSDDRKVLRELYESFADEPRVRMIDDHRAEQQKGIIANCRFFVGARTHATIAAYSTLVPTLVIGYSVKARGIAQDLFGQSEHYVLPVQTLQNPRQLTEAFRWMMDHEEQIHYALAGAIPLYLKKVQGNAEILRGLLQQV
ncbi:MAG: polysaccharide pyruvyl transferase family protein [Lachnospiraceae bacterium]|nr:polysaccharide pyruvyl transferase family protein [Lachnospiraceae bacterium]